MIRKAGVPCQYFCRRSLATWDVLLHSSEQATKVVSCNITTKLFRLQPEYLGTRRIRVTVCNVPDFITGEVLAAFLSAYERVEEINLLMPAAGTAYGDYVFRLCLTREGFHVIPETIISRERQMMVVVEGRRPRCWGTSPSFAQKRIHQMLQLPRPPQLLQQQQSPQPPSAAKAKLKKRSQVRPRPNKPRKAGPK